MDATNRSKGKRKGGSYGATTITDKDTSWLEESCDKTPLAFFDKFGILKCEDGHRRYERALRHSDMCEQERTLLTNSFEAWKNSEGPSYWERQNTKVAAKKSAWKTAGNMIRGSVQQYDAFGYTVISVRPELNQAVRGDHYCRNAEEQRQHFAAPSDTPIVSDTQYPINNTLHRTSDASRLTPSGRSASKDHAKRTRTTMTKNLPKKRMRLRDPWHDLADIAIRLFNGNVVDLPSEKSMETEKDPERKKLYELAWRHLSDAKEGLGQQNANKEMRLHFRDAFVALSGVFNLYSFQARKALSSADCLDAKGLCLMPELEYKDEELTKLLGSLMTTKTRKLTAILEDVYSWLSSKPTFRLFLLVLRNIIENILNPHHGDNKPSECDALLIWGSILKDGRPKGTPFTFYLGEHASGATRVSKNKLACALNTGYNARKCDCTLSIGKIQFGNGEAKRASTSPVAVKVQLRKNIKIARSVMLDL
ncbi:hypothetical protein BGZ50_002804, partial [Haplosporangium sp. Z 11]